MPDGPTGVTTFSAFFLHVVPHSVFDAATKATKRLKKKRVI